MHNGRLADPLDEYTQALKGLTGKRAKTDEDHEEVARAEWMGSLYTDEQGRPCWPGENVEIMIRNAARKEKRGKDVEKGLMSAGNWPLKYQGPKDLEALWKSKKFLHRARVKQGIIRTRPMFTDWELVFDVDYDDEVLDQRDLVRWIEYAGRYIGLSDWRPKFGRFEVLSIEAVEE